MKSEFGGDVEFAAGSVYGSRSFEVMEDGTLGAVTWNYTWKDGENIAECLNDYRVIPGLANILRYQVIKLPPHTIENCPMHGFYAYTNGANKWGTLPTRIDGVIEGYGITHIGTKGFRAEKAKIAGLVIPAKPQGRIARWNEYRRTASFSARMLGMVLYFLLFNVGLQLILNVPWYGKIGGAALMLSSLYVLLNFVWAKPDYSKANFSRYGLSTWQMYDKIREQYPSAKTFETYDEMLEHFKITKTVEEDDYVI